MAITRLGADGVGRTFGPVHALDDVTFAAREQTIHALLGENGAGKTTLIRSLSGLDQPTSGSVIVDDEPVQFSGPRDAFAAGIAVVQQELALSPNLTLLENLVLGVEPTKGGSIDWAGARQRAEELAESIGARIPWGRRAADVEVGTLQQTEIVRCLFRGANTLIFDEPSAVLAPSQIEGLLNLLRSLREQGNTIIIITHKLDEALAVADDVTVLRGGKVVHSQPAKGLDREQLATMVVGDSLPQQRTERVDSPSDVVLGVSELVVAGRQTTVGPVSFEVRTGEVLGLAGVAGNGQEDLVEAIMGLRPAAGGNVTVSGKNLTRASVARRRRAGISYISSDRRGEGLSITESLIENTVVGMHRRAPLAKHGWLAPAACKRWAEDILGRFNVRFGKATDPAASLSGGNQQKMVFGREMSLEPRLLVAAQPTRGVDIRGIRELHDVMLAARDDGVAIVLMSQELDELLAMSDRVLVMYHGNPAGIFDPADADAKVRIGRAMLGGEQHAFAAVSPGGDQ